MFTWSIVRYLFFLQNYVFQGNQILGNLSPDEYSRIIKVLEDAILATDLAVYFRLDNVGLFKIVLQVYLSLAIFKQNYHYNTKVYVFKILL